MFCTFVTNAKVREPHEMLVITFNLSDQFVFLFIGLKLATVRSESGEANTKASGHILEMSAAILQQQAKVTCSKCCLHPMFINIKLKVAMYFFNGCTYFPCAPASFATYLS